MKKLILTGWTVLLPMLLAAEEVSSPMSAGIAGMVKTFASNVVEAAEAMPEADYDFRPAPEARSFAELVAHLTDSNRTFCGAASGTAHGVDVRTERKTRKEGGKKHELVTELKASLEPCNAVLSELDDVKLARLVRFGGGQLIDGRPIAEREIPLSTVLVILATHTSLHYGNLATYLRIKDVVPPSSRNIER